MPPALSDYDSTSASDSDWDSEPQAAASIEERVVQVKSPIVRTPLLERQEGKQSAPESKVTKELTRVSVARDIGTSAASKKRKRSTLLSGLGLDNIITVADDEDSHSVARDTPPTSSIPTSSLRTRGQTNAMQNSRPLYDQKYHPMDDVVQPSRAARHRAKYEEQNLDEDSEGTDFQEDDQSDSDVGVDHHRNTNKRRKLSHFPPTQGTRHSSRRTNRNVLYDMNVHPQDEEIEQMEIDSDQEGTSADEDAGPSQVTDGNTTMVGGRVIPDTGDDTASEQSSSSPPRSSPLSSITLGPLRATGIRLVPGQVLVDTSRGHRRSPRDRHSNSPGFHIYEDPVDVQLQILASAPAPLNYPHDDKENMVEDMESDDEPVVHDNTTVLPAAELTEEQIGALSDPAMDYVEPSMFDGSSDGMDYVHHTAVTRRDDERDSVLGTPSPSRTFDRGSDGAIERLHKTPPGGFALLR
ncbi:hypothetical protein K458DRAFT_391154 [Lentithecium fluviatile CBS 122367]|uniref:Uncharacterized protein n=1 Tax=Lentithecium fluviatile CBS 122367 TaxID=1168545 RepID=A0A6G1IVW1_9PLEO|nr:hypothetical protein K458DRAFT_391154 [Lentithecium fluviatile CBS 122367]